MHNDYNIIIIVSSSVGVRGARCRRTTTTVLPLSPVGTRWRWHAFKAHILCTVIYVCVMFVSKKEISVVANRKNTIGPRTYEDIVPP